MEKTKEVEKRTLFERLGGTSGITAIVDDVVQTHMENPAISKRFTAYNDKPERMAVIKKHTVDFFSAGSGGAVEYKGRSMEETHAGMNISREEYTHVIDDIMQVLDKHGMSEDTKKEVLAILWSLKGMIIGQ
ncbi:group I truncated hemoglobin [Draconibacterium halophilum]|uniref:Group 1 truncated hemoglobin n=1 Tax=Draconibacterium halophilum TaxID=2706887 RepID=A0A6C0R9A6_9BACT|nr:group 1 truncated hemoglobin [Draconibacterium halophilum]QIA06456.1 group 1 truncated hemoglobin [Draconibacterium halophilum]